MQFLRMEVRSKLPRGTAKQVWRRGEVRNFSAVHMGIPLFPKAVTFHYLELKSRAK